MKTDEPVWAILFFDLPVDTKVHRRAATQYRTFLLNLGFSRIQLSVYSKYLVNSGGFDWLANHVGFGIPGGGQVRMVAVSDREWSSMVRYEGQKVEPSEPKPEQLTIF